MKQPSRVTVWVIIGTVLFLFAAALLGVLVNDALLIRDEMCTETEAQFQKNRDHMAALLHTLPEDAAGEDLLRQYYLELAEMNREEAFSRSVTSVQFLMAGDGTVLRDRVLLVTVYEADQDPTMLSVLLPPGNDAELVNLLQLLERIQPFGDSAKVLEGYRADDQCFLSHLELAEPGGYRNVLYDLPAERIPDGAETFRYAVTGKGNGTSWMAVEAVPKPMEQWQKQTVRQLRREDHLLERILSDMFFFESEEWYRAWQTGPEFQLMPGSLRSVVQIGACSVRSALTGTAGPERMCYVYATEFSPLGLAWQEILRNGTVWILLLSAGSAMCLLLWIFCRMRALELRGLRDELTRQEQALAYAKNAEQSRREMTSAIAHELKTPVAVLTSYAEALEERIEPEKQAKYFSVIREETGKMDRMVMELLDLSRLEAGKYRLRREDFDLEQLARDMIEPLEPLLSEKNLRLEWQVENPNVNGDPARIGQVIENYMTNAIRHTPPGGRIILRIGNQRETFSVENQGSRIPPEQLPRVWDAFWQGDASRGDKGSGLGLAICKTILALHGGSCCAENTGFGVRFSFSLEKNQRLFQTGRMPREETIPLDFPIAQQYTTLEHVMTRLNFVKGKLLQQELQDGNFRLGNAVVTDGKTRLYPGYVLSWREYRITITLENDTKRRALLMEHARNGGLGGGDQFWKAGIRDMH